MCSLNTHKCRSCICSAKTPACPCISPAATPVTGYALQPSDSNPSCQSRYYHSCRHKSNSLCDGSHCYSFGQLCDYFEYYNRDQHATALAVIVPLAIHSASHSCDRLLLQQPSSQVTGEPIARELVTRQLGNLAWLKKSTRDIPEASGTF